MQHRNNGLSRNPPVSNNARMHDVSFSWADFGIPRNGFHRNRYSKEPFEKKIPHRNVQWLGDIIIPSWQSPSSHAHDGAARMNRDQLQVNFPNPNLFTLNTLAVLFLSSKSCLGIQIPTAASTTFFQPCALPDCPNYIILYNDHKQDLLKMEKKDKNWHFITEGLSIAQ